MIKIKLILILLERRSFQHYISLLSPLSIIEIPHSPETWYLFSLPSPTQTDTSELSSLMSWQWHWHWVTVECRRRHTDTLHYNTNLQTENNMHRQPRLFYKTTILPEQNKLIRQIQHKLICILYSLSPWRSILTSAWTTLEGHFISYF